eukprot:1141519-Pyramimonas_sp.AAC.1
MAKASEYTVCDNWASAVNRQPFLPPGDSYSFLPYTMFETAASMQNGVNLREPRIRADFGQG